MPEKVAILAQALKGLGGLGQGVWRGASHVGGGPVGGALLLGTGAATTAVAAPMAIQNTQNNFRDSMAERNIVPKVAHMPALDNAYLALHQGVLKEAEVQELESFADMLKGADWKTHAAQGAAVAGGAAATGLAMAGIAKGINAAVDALTYAGDFKSMMAANPDLAEYPEPEIRMVFASLRHLNPEFSKDPLVSGTFVRGRMENRLQSGSGGFEAPRVELGTAKDLAQGSQFMSQASKDPLNEMLQGAGQMGLEHAGRGHQGEGNATHKAQLDLQNAFNGPQKGGGGQRGMQAAGGGRYGRP